MDYTGVDLIVRCFLRCAAARQHFVYCVPLSAPELAGESNMLATRLNVTCQIAKPPEPFSDADKLVFNTKAYPAIAERTKEES